MEWKLLSKEYLFRDDWFTIRKDTCERGDGKIISPYYVYEFPEWVTAVALTKEGQIVLERQYRHAIGKTAYELPGGCVDDTDAGLEAALARELLEETGYRFGSYQYLGKTCCNPSTHNNWMHMFLAREGERVTEPHLDEYEEIEVELVTLKRLQEIISSGEILQSMHVTACYYAFRELGLITF